MILRVFALGVVVLSASGCSNPEAALKEQQIRLGKRSEALSLLLTDANSQVAKEEAGLLIQLAFGVEADLDLYVTGPLLETVYFANHESKSGGSISDDVRCDGQPFRIEEVRFDAPTPGRYRVGVDHPEQCNGNNDPAAYVISVLHNGMRQEKRGFVSLRQFDVIVLEFDVAALEVEGSSI